MLCGASTLAATSCDSCLTSELSTRRRPPPLFDFFMQCLAVVRRFCVPLTSARAPVRCVTDGGGTALGEISVARLCTGTGTERFVGSGPLGWERGRATRSHDEAKRKTTAEILKSLSISD
jgi:hypothetical protein